MDNGFLRPARVMRGCSETVTVWNRFRCPVTGRESFYRHVLPVLCKWRQSAKRGEYRSNNGSAGVTNSLVAIVPYSGLFVPYDVWRELDEDSRRRYFTLNVTDLIARGAFLGDNYEITGAPSNTEAAVKSRAGALTVSGFTDNTARRYGRHYKVGCFYGLKSGF